MSNGRFGRQVSLRSSKLPGNHGTRCRSSIFPSLTPPHRQAQFLAKIEFLMSNSHISLISHILHYNTHIDKHKRSLTLSYEIPFELQIEHVSHNNCISLLAYVFATITFLSFLPQIRPKAICIAPCQSLFHVSHFTCLFSIVYRKSYRAKHSAGINISKVGESVQKKTDRKIPVSTWMFIDFQRIHKILT